MLNFVWIVAQKIWIILQTTLSIIKFLIIYPLSLLFILYISSLIIFFGIQLNRLFFGADQFSIYCTAVMWRIIGYIYNGYNVVGLENLPDKGPGLIIFYHGSLPLEIIYAISQIYLTKKRLVATVVDRFFIALPGFSLMRKICNITTGDVDSCTKCLQEGNLLAISPGGVREAQFASSTNYDMLWSNRRGYAQIAINAECPVYFMFTTNCRQVTVCLPFARQFFRWLYERTRLPLLPIFGIFPVKMTTYISKPIYAHSLSLTEFDQQVRNGMKHMIHTYQKLPGSMLNAHLDRLFSQQKINVHEL